MGIEANLQWADGSAVKYVKPIANRSAEAPRQAQACGESFTDAKRYRRRLAKNMHCRRVGESQTMSTPTRRRPSFMPSLLRHDWGEVVSEGGAAALGQRYLSTPYQRHRRHADIDNADEFARLLKAIRPYQLSSRPTPRLFGRRRGACDAVNYHRRLLRRRVYRERREGMSTASAKPRRRRVRAARWLINARTRAHRQPRNHALLNEASMSRNNTYSLGKLTIS